MQCLPERLQEPPRQTIRRPRDNLQLCGPKMSLSTPPEMRSRLVMSSQRRPRLLREGSIVAVKGIGGFHLAALATEDGSGREAQGPEKQTIPAIRPHGTQILAAVKSFASPDIYESRALVVVAEADSPRQEEGRSHLRPRRTWTEQGRRDAPLHGHTSDALQEA